MPSSFGSAPIAAVEPTADVLARWAPTAPTGGTAPLHLTALMAVAALTAIERDRARQFRRLGDAADFVAAHLLAREAAAAALGGDPRRLQIIARCPECGSDRHGAPAVAEAAGLGISLSHSAGVVAAAAGEGPIGIDVEARGGGRGVDRLDAVLTAAERDQVAQAADPQQEFLTLWVRKEALVKAGAATLDTLDAIDLAGDRDRWAGWTLSGHALRSDGGERAVAAVAARRPTTWIPANSRAEIPGHG